MNFRFHVGLILSVILMPADALAYIGPGAGLSAIGSLLALVAAILLGIVGFIWYPVKRLFHRRKTMREKEEKE